MADSADVLVIGAGAAGLTTARALADRGLSVVVCEARDRIGGRVWTLREAGEEPVELGAIYIHGERAFTWQIIEDAGLTASPPQPRGGRAVFVVNGEVRRAADIYADPDVATLASAEKVIASRNPSDQSLIRELDDIGWSHTAKALAAEWFSQIWCADPAQLSAEGIARVEQGWRSGTRNFVVAEGYDRVLEHVARGLDVQLRTRIHRIRWAPGKVEAHAQRGRTIKAQAAVVTFPPPLLSRIAVLPGLGNEKTEAARSILLGPVTRVFATLNEPAPETASVTILGEAGGLWRVREGSRVLTGWIGGPAALRAADASPCDLVLRLSDAVPWLSRGRLDGARAVHWAADPYARGGYSYPRVGALDAPAAWAEPVASTLFFAGEATCGDTHPATVHGAMESGLRAAEEVMEALSRG